MIFTKCLQKSFAAIFGSGLMLSSVAFAQNSSIRLETSDAEIQPKQMKEGESRPRFDWEPYKGVDRVPHPDAKRGLLRVTKDKVYVYKVKTSEQTRGVSFRLGYFDPTKLKNPEAVDQANSTFAENYDSTSNPTFLLDYEWQLLHIGIAKVGLKVGSGFYIAQGNGHFETPQTGKTGVDKPRETFTFLMLPNSLGAVARFQIWDNQLIVPYVDGGVLGFTFSEFRDDGQNPKFGGAFGAYGAVGGQFNLSVFDAITRAQLDREYGINRIFIVGEYRTVLGLSDKYDFSSDLINGGFLMEF
ncbi:MAG TPA: hypothetical protein DCL41_08780 [Bdellovibrionales bacterium]|nr:hypothetical protein [Bdellovibrionales bacterium]